MWALLAIESDPVSNHPQGVGFALKAMSMHALLLQGPHHAFDCRLLVNLIREFLEVSGQTSPKETTYAQEQIHRESDRYDVEAG